jgi:CheY-like chemotaxis protein
VVAFIVSDTGIGIPEDKQQLIFEAFQQADASTSRTYGGTGLGLTISRELAQLLGGELSVKSAPGAGSTFTLYLPVVARDLEQPAEPPANDVIASSPGAQLFTPEPELPTQSTEELRGKKVLLVDDDARNLFAVTSLLERCRMQVVTASTAQEGLAALREHPDFDLTLMDIMLPGMDGYQATREIRAMAQYRTLPIIAVTAKAMPGDREKCIDAGCTAFVAKPVDANRLILTMKQVLAAQLH